MQIQPALRYNLTLIVMAITKKKQANGDEHVGEKGIQKHYFGE
jgi:hypothetical protein